MGREALKAEYDRLKNARPKITLTYDQFFKLFQEPGSTCASIGRQLGIHKMTVAAYYGRYFQPIFGRSASERLRAAKRQEREDIVREFPEESRSVISIVARAAERAGLTVHRTPKQGHVFELRRKALLIDGNLCRMYHLRTAHRVVGGTQRYTRVMFWRPQDGRKISYVAHILYITIPGQPCRIFVVPDYVVSRLSGKTPKIMAHIPVEQRPPYRPCHQPRVDWWKYLDAWHLLEGEE